MWAVVLHEYGGPDKLHWEEIEDPQAGEGEVLVRIAAASVNPVDWKMRSGEVKDHFPLEFPAVLGFDGSGVIRAVGPGVERFAAGDRVMALTRRTYGELAVVKAAELARVPDDLDLVESAALPLVTMTGEQLITRGAGLERGQTVLVAGAVGSVGRVAVHVAKQCGATVIAGVRARQREAAAALGADEVIALDKPDEVAKLGLLDAIADTVGGETAQKLMEKVKQGGVFASVLGPPANTKLHPTVRLASVVAEPDARRMEALADDVLHRRLVIPIDRMVPLREAAAAQTAAERGAGGKILLLA